MTDTVRSWPLYAVVDLRERDGVRLGAVTEDDEWSITYPSPEEFSSLPLPDELHDVMRFWFNELQREVDAANGADNGATPMSAGRMEWRRALHNNNLRIGPAETRPVRAAT